MKKPRTSRRVYRGVRIELGPWTNQIPYYRYAFAYRGALFMGGGKSRQVAFNAAAMRIDVLKGKRS